MTDDALIYRKIAKKFADHQAVNHSAGEYVRGDAHINTIEAGFSLFKRGMTGGYQHCESQHLHRYLADFDFRYNNRSASMLTITSALPTRSRSSKGGDSLTGKPTKRR